MQIELTEQQRRALEGHDRELARAINPETKETFVLVPVQVFERVKSILDDGFDPRQAYPWVDQTMAEDDANDPYLETYQSFRPEKKL